MLTGPTLFVTDAAEKLMTYALGRALSYQTCRRCGPSCVERPRDENRFSSLILGVVESVPFQMRIKKAAGRNRAPV